MVTAPSLIGPLEIALYAEDLEAAAAFWTGVMGLAEISRQPGRHVFLKIGAQVLLIFNPLATAHPPSAESRLPVPAHGATGSGHFCLAVRPEDLDPWRQHLETSGVEIEADFIWPQGGRSIYFRDPAGNSIELADPAIWPQLR
ncbi:VOC family protein [Paracoccus aminophilus]|uniref:VOC domain-containing protein n=1 Tax=Paracoccus aminophilus JCM 7686 TaxID=1367847 RepID=S5XP84_PARAH|nr:VOC family protein [Paracoccus aminophilus]AGT09134.1 hypothetical protein JCM7686_2053 [Paracoccus aminophilus JCM 7686]